MDKFCPVRKFYVNVEAFGMDYKQAAGYWEDKDAAAKQMDRAALLAQTEKFILAHNTCALATGYGDFVRCTPIEYTYLDGCFWLLSEGGLKFSALERNKNVCLAVFDAYTGFGKLGGMQVTGTAQTVEPWSEEYLKLLEYKKIPAAALRGLPHTMYLIKITPSRIDFLNSDFKKQGFDSRQYIVFG
jgi:hypothetical protein